MNNLFLKGVYDHNLDIPLKGKIVKEYFYCNNRRINKHIVRECVNTLASVEDRTVVDIKTLCIEMNHVLGSTQNMEILTKIKDAPDENLDS